jgi:Spy/CpxP family protein refolding chaperone
MKSFALILLPALSLTAAACHGPHHRGGNLDPARLDKEVSEHLDDVLDDVKASDAQRARIQSIEKRLLPDVAALAASQKEARQEIVTQLSSERPDTARLHALVDRQVDAFRALAHKSVDGAVEAHGTLTPEQRAPLVKKMRRFASR